MIPLMLRVVGRRDRHVEPQHVGLGRAGVVLEPVDQAGGDPGEQDREQVGSVTVGVVVELGQVREHAGVEDRQELGQLGPRDVLARTARR